MPKLLITPDGVPEILVALSEAGYQIRFIPMLTGIDGVAIEATRVHTDGMATDEEGEEGMSLTSNLYRAARISNNVSTLASGDPDKVKRRLKNILVGRALGRLGAWGRLWR